MNKESLNVLIVALSTKQHNAASFVVVGIE